MTRTQATDASKSVLSHEEGHLSPLQKAILSLWQQLPQYSTTTTVICDIATGSSCLFVPAPFRHQVYNFLHFLSHPSIRATQQLITSCLVWPGINKDVRMWSRACLQCQHSKVHQHTSHLCQPDICFDHIHINLVRPLSLSSRYIYMLTCSDCLRHWPEAIPILDIRVETIA